MYKSIIKFKDDLSSQKIAEITALCDSAFDNRAGKLDNQSTDPNVLIYQSDNPIGALGIGDVKIAKLGLISFFQSWDFIDETTGKETCDIIKTTLAYYAEQGIDYYTTFLYQ